MPDNLIEVWFKIQKDAEGFPKSRDWEGLKCLPQEGNEYQVRSVPFYLREVAYGDRIVAEKNEKGFFEFKSITSRSGYSVFRLWLHNEDENTLIVVKELVDLGYLVEFDKRLVALAVPPPKSLEAAASYILAGKHSGRWGAQDGYLAEQS